MSTYNQYIADTQEFFQSNVAKHLGYLSQIKTQFTENKNTINYFQQVNRDFSNKIETELNDCILTQKFLSVLPNTIDQLIQLKSELYKLQSINLITEELKNVITNLVKYCIENMNLQEIENALNVALKTSNGAVIQSAELAVIEKLRTIYNLNKETIDKFDTIKIKIDNAIEEQNKDMINLLIEKLNDNCISKLLEIIDERDYKIMKNRRIYDTEVDNLREEEKSLKEQINDIDKEIIHLERRLASDMELYNRLKNR